MSIRNTSEAAVDPRTEDAGRARASLSDLPVRVKFEIGDWSVTLKELTALVPGYVLPLPSPAEEVGVRLTAQGMEIAKGRLISLGQAYGVIIDEMAGA